MGAGDRGGPERCAQACQGRCGKDFGKRELRHEHADDEQRLRHSHVADRRLKPRERVPAVGA